MCIKDGVRRACEVFVTGVSCSVLGWGGRGGGERGGGDVDMGDSRECCGDLRAWRAVRRVALSSFCLASLVLPRLERLISMSSRRACSVSIEASNVWRAIMKSLSGSTSAVIGGGRACIGESIRDCERARARFRSSSSDSEGQAEDWSSMGDAGDLGDS